VKSTNSNDKPPMNTWASHLSHMEASRNATTSNPTTDMIEQQQQPQLIADKTEALAMMTMEQNVEITSSTKSSDDDLEVSNVWYRLDVPLQCDYDVAMAAVQAKCIPTNILLWPVELRHNIKFWNDLLLHQSHVLEGNDQNHTDTDSQRCSCIPVWASATQIRSMLNYHPTLQSNINFWYTVLHCGFLSTKLLVEAAHPTLVLGHKNFMLHAIQSDFHLYGASSAPLKQDADLVMCALKQSATVIQHIPVFVQEMYIDAIIDAVKNLIHEEHGKYAMTVWPSFVSPQLWANRNFIYAYAHSGFEYDVDNIPPEYLNDKELFLIFAAHNYFSLYHASTELCTNKEFMTKAIELNGYILAYVKGELRYDYELATIAFSKSGISNFDYNEFYNSNEFRESYWEYIKNRVLDYLCFFQFVQAVTIERDYQAPLTLLNQGKETTVTLLKHIQEYVGSPIGVESKRVRRVWNNIISINDANSE
jgi:hypothetical protein